MKKWYEELKEQYKYAISGYPKKFVKYNDFKRFVLLTAQKELKEKTDICFDFEEIKKVEPLFLFGFELLNHSKT